MFEAESKEEEVSIPHAYRRVQERECRSINKGQVEPLVVATSQGKGRVVLTGSQTLLFNSKNPLFMGPNKVKEDPEPEDSRSETAGPTQVWNPTSPKAQRGGCGASGWSLQSLGPKYWDLVEKGVTFGSKGLLGPLSSLDALESRRPLRGLV